MTPIVRWLLAAVSLPSIALAQPLGPSAPLNDVLARLSDKVVQVEPFRPDGLDLRRGVVLSLNAEPSLYGICRAQKITLFQKRDGALDRVEVENRYQADDWKARDSAPSVCGDARQGHWTTAQDDSAFSDVLPAIGQIYRLTVEGRPVARYPFKFVCTRYAEPCADPAADLKTAFASGVGEVSREGSVIWARRNVYLSMPYWDMRIDMVSGAIATVTLRFTVPPIS